MPERYRGKGLGSIMLTMFLKAVFLDPVLNLNKVYATTSAGNHPSMRLLEKHGFHLDGRNREHYWIEEHRHDQMIYSLLRREWEECSEKFDRKNNSQT
jgi:RimJ/RimL family protein N-acetyltransferase